MKVYILLGDGHEGDFFHGIFKTRREAILHALNAPHEMNSKIDENTSMEELERIFDNFNYYSIDEIKL